MRVCRGLRPAELSLAVLSAYGKLRLGVNAGCRGYAGMDGVWACGLW